MRLPRSPIRWCRRSLFSTAIARSARARRSCRGCSRPRSTNGVPWSGRPASKSTESAPDRGAEDIFGEDSNMGRWLIRVLATMFAVAAASTLATAQSADTVLLDGKIVTVDDRFTIAQALAIHAGRIVKVGTTAEIEALKGAATRTIDLKGRTVIPGLID